jgi:hypothetical protein
LPHPRRTSPFWATRSNAIHRPRLPLLGKLGATVGLGNRNLHRIGRGLVAP